MNDYRGKLRNATKATWEDPAPGRVPVFCILQVFVNGVSGGTDSPSPIVTSSTNDMDGVLTLGLSKS